jgi:hypothetical protein
MGQQGWKPGPAPRGGTVDHDGLAAQRGDESLPHSVRLLDALLNRRRTATARLRQALHDC